MLMALAAALAGCQSHDTSSSADAKKAITRVVNPQPKHIVEIEGRLPPSLEVVLFAQYWTDTEDRSCFVMPQAEWGQGPNYLREPLAIERKNDRYQVRLAVDKYLPGQCNWMLRSVDANIAKKAREGDIEAVEGLISTYLYGSNADSSGCDGTGHDDCPGEENSLAMPVVVPCKVADFSDANRGTKDRSSSLFCNVLTARPYKEGHRLRPGQGKVQIDFYDLEVDADPMIIPARARAS